MRKKILGAITTVAILVIIVFNLNINTGYNKSSTLTLDNIDALAWGEDMNGPCYVCCRSSEICYINSKEGWGCIGFKCQSFI